jgi:hypothetical protein
VLQLETELRQKDAQMDDALAAAAGGRDKQVGVLLCAGEGGRQLAEDCCWASLGHVARGSWPVAVTCGE